MSSYDSPSRFGSPATIAVVAVLLGAAVLLGPLVSMRSFDARYFVALVLGMAFLFVALMPSARVMQFSFVMLILSYGLGWRTIHITSELSIHPLEALTWMLFVSLLIRGLVRRENMRFQIPVLLLCFVLLATLGILPSFLLRRRALDLVLQDYKIHLIAIPTFYVVQWMIANRKDWERAARWCLIVAVYVGVLGLLDAFLPGLSASLSGRDSADVEFVDYAGFSRSGFVLYGSFMAGFLIYLLFGFAIRHFLSAWRSGDLRRRAFGAAAALVPLAGMYITGYRGLWYTLVGFLGLVAVMKRRVGILLVGAMVAVPFLPDSFWLRFQSLVDTRYADSSYFDRLQRMQYAIAAIEIAPLTGVGYGAGGYAHSDILQTAATLGVPAAIVFVLVLVLTIWMLIHLLPRRDWIAENAGIFIALLIGQIAIFAGEGLVVWVQMMAPYWFVIAMMHKLAALARQEDAERRALAAAAPAIVRVVRDDVPQPVR